MLPDDEACLQQFPAESVGIEPLLFQIACPLVIRVAYQLLFSRVVLVDGCVQEVFVEGVEELSVPGLDYIEGFVDDVELMELGDPGLDLLVVQVGDCEK